MKSLLFKVALIAIVIITVGHLQTVQANPRRTIQRSLGNSPSADSSTSSIIISPYLQLKNALASDNTNAAAVAGGKLYTALVNLGKQHMNDAQKKAYAAIADEAEVNAEHISKNGGNINHQREHFQGLSENIYNLVKVFGNSQTLYKDYCPMVKAIWLSEFKEIKNPYYGNSMSNCGQVKDVLKK